MQKLHAILCSPVAKMLPGGSVLLPIPDVRYWPRVTIWVDFGASLLIISRRPLIIGVRIFIQRSGIIGAGVRAG